MLDGMHIFPTKGVPIADSLNIQENADISKSIEGKFMEELRRLAGLADESTGDRVIPAEIIIESSAFATDEAELPGLENDIVFGDVMKREEIALPLLSDIIGRDIVSMQLVEEQKTFSGVTSEMEVTTIRLDVFMLVKDSDGDSLLADIEIQGYRQKHFYKRLRMYGADMDHTYEYRTGNDKYALRERYMISFMSNRVIAMSDEAPAYQICLIKNQFNQVINNGVTWVLVNYDRLEDLISEDAPKTVLEIVRKINREQVETPYGIKLTEAVEEFLSNAERRLAAMTIGEKIRIAREDAAEEAMAMGLERGKEQGKEQERRNGITILINTLKGMGVPWEQIVQRIQVSYPGADVSDYHF